jgi:hypothetical protein
MTEDLGGDRKIKLKLILKKWDVLVSTEFIWLRMGTRRGTCQNGNEPLTFTKDRIIV